MRSPNESSPNPIPPAHGAGARPELGHGASWIRALAGEWRQRQKVEAVAAQPARSTPPPRPSRP